MATKEAPENTAPAPAARPARLRALRLLVRAAIFVILFGVAALISWLCVPAPVKQTATEHGEHEAVEIPKRKIAAEATPAEILERGDSALADFRFSHAISHYEELLQVDAIGVPAIAYRLGLCNEMLDRVDMAIAHYRSALSVATSPALSFTCQVGVARCFLRKDRPAEARRVLHPLLLDEAKQHEVSPALIADARSLLALAWAREAQTAPADPLALDVFVPYSQAALETPIYLEEAAGKPAGKPAGAEPRKFLARFIVEKATGKKGAQVKELEQTGQTAKELLDRLVAGAGWRAEWTPAAITRVESHAIHVNIRHWDLADLLDCLADPFGVACRLEGDAVRFAAADEAGKEGTATRQAAVRRALARASEVGPEHLYAPAVWLELGNLAAADRKSDEAARWYDRIAREWPTSPYMVLSRYNLAQLHLRNQDFPKARRSFYQVVDQAPAHEFALRAYLRLGQLLLIEEENREAIVCLRRAQALAPHSAFRPLATLTLAAALLKLGDPANAHRAMDADRGILHKDQYKPTATFLDAYAKYQLARANESRRREAAALLSTLWHYREASAIGQLGKYLIAEAYADLSFPQEAERVLIKTSADAQGTVMACIEFRLAEIMLTKGQAAAAKERFEKIAKTSPSYRPQATFQLARIDLNQKRWQDCAAKCAKLWQEQSLAEPSAVLQLWGAALEGAGDYGRAAQCYAGKAPE